MHIKSTQPRLLLFFIICLICSATFSVAQTKKIDSLIVVLNKEKSEVAKIPILRTLSQSLTAVDPDKKYIYAKQMRNIAIKYQIDSVVPIAYLDMAMVHGIKTDYDSSMYYLTKGLAIAKEKGIKSQEARAYVGIGYTYDRLDDPKTAIENYELAIKIFKKIQNQKGLNQAHINLGSLYFDQNEFKIAESYFTQALNSFQKMNDQPGIAYGNFILGNTSRALGKEDEAYQYYTKSLTIREKLGDINGIALANFGLGELYLKQKEYSKAINVLKIAIDNNRILNNKYQETVALITLGRVYLEIRDIKSATETAILANTTAKELNSKGLIINTLSVLIEINEFTKNYKNAFEYQKDSNEVKDSLNAEKVKKDFIYADFKRMRTENTDLETTNEVISNKNLTYQRAIYIISTLLLIVVVLLFLYLRKIRQKNLINQVLETKKNKISTINKELENVNEELKVQISVTSSQKRDLERVNAVKNKFFSIVSHDLRSPIATLKMLFSTYFSGHLTKEEMDNLLKKLQETIYNTADFLDNLLEWSKSQLEGMVVKAEPFQVQPMVDRTLEILNAQIVEKSLNVKNNIDETAYAFADKNMINVVLRNLISNSIKFCNAGDSIILKGSIGSQSLLITIQDTGIGINPEEKEKIFQLEHSVSQGTSGETGHHIGLVLCKNMVEQNRGKIWFESSVGVGTTFFVEIPNVEM